MFELKDDERFLVKLADERFRLEVAESVELKDVERFGLNDDERFGLENAEAFRT